MLIDLKNKTASITLRVKMWLSTTVFFLILSTLKCSSSSINDDYNEDLPKYRESQALSAESVNNYKLYETMTTKSTLATYFKSLLGTAINVIGWFIVTISWTFSGLSSIEESIFDYDYVGRIVNHYTDPQTAGERITKNIGYYFCWSFILIWLTLYKNIEDGDHARKKRHFEDLYDDSFVGEFLVVDRVDPNCDATCEFYQNLYSIMDNTFKYVIITLCNNLVVMVAKFIFWNLMVILPDPQIIVESFEDL